MITSPGPGPPAPPASTTCHLITHIPSPACRMELKCLPVTSQSLASFRSGMVLCFRRAVELGLSIAIVPHLDDAQQAGACMRGHAGPLDGRGEERTAVARGMGYGGMEGTPGVGESKRAEL